LSAPPSNNEIIIMLQMTLTDGDILFGRDAAELVSRMRETMWTPPPTVEEYITETSERVAQMTGTRPRTDPDGFVADLERLGLVTVRLADG
jgi:hypothetical protein